MAQQGGGLQLDTWSLAGVWGGGSPLQDWGCAARALLPAAAVLAVIFPHRLYLQSSVSDRKQRERRKEGKSEGVESCPLRTISLLQLRNLSA